MTSTSQSRGWAIPAVEDVYWLETPTGPYNPE